MTMERGFVTVVCCLGGCWFAGCAGSSAPKTHDPGTRALKAIPVDVPGGAGGAGFDDLRWAPALGRVLVPGARTGNLDLIDPVTREVKAIGGFSADDKFE